MTRMSQALVALAVGLLLVVPAVAFVLSYPRFGGYDCYFFFLYANDLAQSASETSFARYSYFPGSYAFWRAVATAAGRDFAAYQRVFAGVGLANAALTGLVVRAAGGGPVLAAASFAGYLLFGPRLELELMTTEALATLAPLLGVVLWLTLARLGKARLGLALLGAGYGLAVFTKQQGAFVAMGAAGLAPYLWGQARPRLQGLGDAATIVAAALAVFAVAMGLDGGGMAAVKLGVATAVDYDSHGQLAAHLIDLARRSPVLFAAMAGAVGLWPPAWILSRRRPEGDRGALLAVWGLGAATAVVTLLQYGKRGYAHYALLTLPFALTTIALAAAWGLERVRAGRRLRVAALVAAASLLGLEAWALPRAGPPEPPRHEVYASACEGIEPGRRLLLLPSREDALHWACGTHARGTRWGYTFNFQERPEDYIDELAKPELTQVFVFNATRPGSYEREIAGRRDWSSFFSALADRGFRPVAHGQAGTLYRRANEETDHGRE